MSEHGAPPEYAAGQIDAGWCVERFDPVGPQIRLIATYDTPAPARIVAEHLNRYAHKEVSGNGRGTAAPLPGGAA